MKIIKRGIKPEERVFQAACHSCETVVEFTFGEASRHTDQRDGDYVSVVCPVCNAPITADAQSYQKLRGISSEGYGNGWGPG